MTSTTRFAPSPNGFLHVGHALSAIIAHDTARADGGRFLLRIEDIDLERRRPEYISAIYEDLSWLGLSWEEPVLVQSEHFNAYLAAADSIDFGRSPVSVLCDAERNSASRADAEKTVPERATVYPGLWRGASGETFGRACCR